LYSEIQRDKLRLTRASLVQILTFHQVMPCYLDFILAFGLESDPKSLGIGGFRGQITIHDPPRALALPAIGRSGRHFELCYNLKAVCKHSDNGKSSGSSKLLGNGKTPDDSKPKNGEWLVRQAAVYHHFDVEFGTTQWIVTTNTTDIQQKYKDLTGSDGHSKDKSFSDIRECFVASLGAHSLFLQWATEG